MKIAIVEDDISIQLMYRLRLENAGYSVRTAGNGEEGLTLLEQFVPDLVLLDLKMPRMGGEEMLRQVRMRSWGANIRVIILTNINKNEAPQALRFLNVDRYIVKAHHTPRQVSEIIEEVLADS